MHRYQASLDGLNSEGVPLWSVLDQTMDGVDIGSGRWLTEAEAKLFEFVLNQAAEGKRIGAESMVDGEVTYYDGPMPTGGVMS
jgi:hypothetical protein